jgi:hypothetical protein
MIASTVFLELATDSPPANSSFMPRCGAWNLIQSISILRNGEEISFVQLVGPWASLKTLAITDSDEQRRMESRTGGALHVDYSETASRISDQSLLGYNGVWSNIPTYSMAPYSQDLSTFTPFLQLRFICDLLAKNIVLDTMKDKYEIVINWNSNSGQLSPSTGANAYKISSNVRLVYSANVSAIQSPKLKELILKPWNEIRFTSFTLNALAAGASDQNTIPIRFSNMPASAIFIAFVPSTPITTTASSCSTVWGDTFSHPISWSSQNEMNLIVNGKSLLPRPITMDSQRIEHFNRALMTIGGTNSSCIAGGNINIYSTNVNPGAGAANVGDLGFWQRGLQLMMANSTAASGTIYATLISSTNYYGFNLMDDNMPTMIDASSMYLVLNRGSQPTQLPIPALTGYVFIVSPKMV